uniref:G-protein coupled receptors family 1 profile domain-containing protein n=1 Tax=Ditylenchus dipsaci TaxID=166011 RepID=A0A915DIA0_9BILA
MINDAQKEFTASGNPKAPAIDVYLTFDFHRACGFGRSGVWCYVCGVYDPITYYLLFLIVIIAPTPTLLPLLAASIERRTVDNVEIVYLSVIILVGTVLNSIVFVQLLRQSKTPTASTSFSTDFAILLVHALGKVIWLVTYEWKFGETGCKVYQFLSAFTYYSNSNVVVAIGIDRLKVVYTSHLQGAASVRRVRFLLACAWIMAALCALLSCFFGLESSFARLASMHDYLADS